MYEINFTKQAVKDLRKIPKDYLSNILEKVKKLSVNPYSLELDIKKLKGIEAYRLRVGEYRIIYGIKGQELIINIIKVRSRGNVYG